MRRRPKSVSEIRREIVGDSLERERLVAKLIQLIRADERDKVLSTMRRVRDNAERVGQ